MLAWNAGKLDYSRLVDRYQELRTVGWTLHNEVLPKYLSEQAFSVCGKKLGIWQQGTLVFDREEEIGVLMDYSIHEHRQGGCNAVQRYLADRRPDVGSDEYAVAKAMSRSFYTLVQVREVLRGVGVRVADLFAGCEYLLLDMGFGKTAVPGIVIATRIYPYDGFVTTGGAPLTVTAESLRETRDTLLPRYGPENEGQCVLRGGRERASDLTTAIIRLCLRREARQIEYESPARGPALTPVRSGPHVARNAPCPCGSGRKYKKCCGQTP